MLIEKDRGTDMKFRLGGQIHYATTFRLSFGEDLDRQRFQISNLKYDCTCL